MAWSVESAYTLWVYRPETARSHSQAAQVRTRITLESRAMNSSLSEISIISRPGSALRFLGFRCLFEWSQTGEVSRMGGKRFAAKSLLSSPADHFHCLNEYGP